jgi:class III cytochrome C family protein
MRIRSRLAVLLTVLCLMLPGYGRTSAEERAKSENSEPASALHQAALQGIASTAALQGSTGKTEAGKAKQAMPKDVVILRGSPLGAVRFDHKLHSLARNTKCETCHHPSRREKPAAALQQACTDCHTKVAIAPMKTKRQAAFHNATAAAGTCIDCHKAENANGKLTPVKCLSCHKKEILEVAGGC